MNSITVLHLGNFIPHNEFNTLWDEHPKEKPQVMMFGKLVKVTRWQQPYIRSYRFSGVDHPASIPPHSFAPLMKLANNVVYKYAPQQGNFNSILVNWYADGNDYIGPHRDEFRELDPKSVIMTISLYANPEESRIMRISEFPTKQHISDIELKHGDVLIIPYASNKVLYHEIIKEKNKTHRRISFTFRKFI
jgi:alkylated DNA repair dioxygenase AlkB